VRGIGNLRVFNVYRRAVSLLITGLHFDWSSRPGSGRQGSEPWPLGPASLGRDVCLFVCLFVCLRAVSRGMSG
jgi:hypothetical protein